jgi:hypothetical protein
VAPAAGISRVGATHFDGSFVSLSACSPRTPHSQPNVGEPHTAARGLQAARRRVRLLTRTGKVGRAAPSMTSDTEPLTLDWPRTGHGDHLPSGHVPVEVARHHSARERDKRGRQRRIERSGPSPVRGTLPPGPVRTVSLRVPWRSTRASESSFAIPSEGTDCASRQPVRTQYTFVGALWRHDRARRT